MPGSSLCWYNEDMFPTFLKANPYNHHQLQNIFQQGSKVEDKNVQVHKKQPHALLQRQSSAHNTNHIVRTSRTSSLNKQNTEWQIKQEHLREILTVSEVDLYLTQTSRLKTKGVTYVAVVSRQFISNRVVKTSTRSRR